MPPRKNQHYVPKHYLRVWATEGNVQTRPLEIEELFLNSLRTICSRDYFYGNPPHVEDALGQLEGIHAKPINKLRNQVDIVNLSQNELRMLYSFVTTQRLRTKSVKEDIEDGSEFIREGVRDDLENERYKSFLTWKRELSKDEKEDSLVDASILSILYRQIILGIFGFEAISDLRTITLHNLTEKEFITSDTPVVMDNHAYKCQKNLKIAGLSNRGLQIYCPLSPRKCILLLDPIPYQINTNTKGQLLLKDLNVIDQINLLQVHNANSVLISKSVSQEYLKCLIDRKAEVRRREAITQTLSTETNLEEILTRAPRHQIPKISPKLPKSTSNPYLPHGTRTSSRADKTQTIVNEIFGKSPGSDVAVIEAIRLFAQMTQTN